MTEENAMVFANVTNNRERLERCFSKAKRILDYAEAGRACMVDLEELKAAQKDIDDDINKAAEAIAEALLKVSPAQIKPGDQVVVFSEDGLAVRGKFSHVVHS